MKSSLLILLVDDDADDKELFFDAVKEVDTSIECLHAENGKEALELLNTLSHLPDLIFLDINMPQMNGLQCLEQIQKTKSLCDIPVIFYTTSKFNQIISESKEFSSVPFYTKPPLYSDIVKLISSILKEELHLNVPV